MTINTAENATAGVPVAPERIWATVNGASTRLPDGVRQFIGGWSEDPTRPRAVEYVKASALDTARAEIERLVAAIGDWARPTGANGMTSAPETHPLVVAARHARATLSPAVKEPK